MNNTGKCIIEDIKPYPSANGKPGNEYMYCFGHSMNILAFHCPVFDNPTTFEILKAGWSFWYFPKKNDFRHAFTGHRFFYNLHVLFGVSTEKLYCSDTPTFWQLLKDRIITKRPLLLWLAGVPKQDNWDHTTFVACGVDFDQKAVLLLSNGLNAMGWMPVEEVGKRVVSDKIFYFNIPDQCKIPSKKDVAHLLLEKVKNNFWVEDILYQWEKKLQIIIRRISRQIRKCSLQTPFREAPPPGTICGPIGISKLARDLPEWHIKNEGITEHIARNFCREIMMLRQERAVFISLLSWISIREVDLLHIQEKWADLSNLWKQVAMAFSKIFMTDKHDVIFEIKHLLENIAENEKSILLCIQELLTKHLTCDTLAEQPNLI